MPNNRFERFTGVNEVRVIQVVEVKSVAGEGTRERPVHEVTEYYSFDGQLLARRREFEKLERGQFYEATSESSLRS